MEHIFQRAKNSPRVIPKGGKAIPHSKLISLTKDLSGLHYGIPHVRTILSMGVHNRSTLQIFIIQQPDPELVFFRMKILEELSNHGSVSLPCNSHTKPTIGFRLSNCFPANKIYTYVLSALPNKISRKSVNSATNGLRQPRNLHTVHWNRIKHGFSQSQPARFYLGANSSRKSAYAGSFQQ